jgi:hypothetical protein
MSNTTNRARLVKGSAMADDDSDDEKITLAQQIFGKKAAFPGRNPLDPKANDLMEVQVPAVATRDSSVSESSPPAAPADGGNRRKPGGRVDSRAKDSGLTMYKVAAPHCQHDAP